MHMGLYIQSTHTHTHRAHRALHFIRALKKQSKSRARSKMCVGTRMHVLFSSSSSSSSSCVGYVHVFMHVYVVAHGGYQSTVGQTHQGLVPRVHTPWTSSWWTVHGGYLSSPLSHRSSLFLWWSMVDP